MSFKNWLPRLLGGNARGRCLLSVRDTAKKRPGKPRQAIEVLEDRIVPAAPVDLGLELEPAVTAVTASSFYPGGNPEKAFDGDPISYWSAGGGLGHITAHFASPATISGVLLSANAQPSTNEDYSILGSNDGVNFDLLAQSTQFVGSNIVANLQPILFPAATYSHIRISVNGQASWVGVNEIKFLGTSAVREGGAVQLAGSFADPDTGDAHAVTINWGDGSSPQTVNLAAGVTSFRGVTHTYLDDNPSGTGSDNYTISVTVTDDALGSTSATTSVTVKNAAPGNVALSPIDEDHGVILSGSFTDPGTQDAHTLTINWGDGSALETIDLVAGITSFSGVSHQYPGPGPSYYTVSVTVGDDDGGQVVQSRRTHSTEWLAVAQNSLWDNPNNWSAGVPDPADDVTINPSNFAPQLNVAAAVRHLTINPGASLNLGSSDLTVSGDFTAAAGTFVASTGRVIFNSATAQTLTSNGNSFYRITHPAVGNLLLGSALTVTNDFTITAGGLYLGGNNWTMTGATFSNLSSIVLRGSETITGLIPDTDSGGWVYVGNANGVVETFTIKDFGASDYFYLGMHSGASEDKFVLAADLKVNGTMEIGRYTVDLRGFNVTLSSFYSYGGNVIAPGAANTFTVRNWNGYNSGYDANGGTVTFGGGNGLLVGTSSVFNNVTLLNNVRLDDSITIPGTLTVNGGSFTMNGRDFAAANVVILSGGFFGAANKVTSSNTFNLQSGTISTRLAGNVGLTKTGAGAATIDVAPIYTGTTTINQGTLNVNTTITTPITVAGGTLAGTGTVSAVTATSGAIAPAGTAKGILQAGAVTLSSGSQLSIDVAGSTAGTQYDQLKVTDINLGGASLALNVTSSGASLKIIDNTGPAAIQGTFLNLQQLGFFQAGSQWYQINYQGGDGNDVVLTAVPPPVVTLTSAATRTVDENGAGAFAITASLQSALPVEVQVPLIVTDLGATRGADYEVSASTLIFAPGQTTATFNVNVVDDSKFELTESFRVALSSASGVGLGALSQNTFDITDDDPLPIVDVFLPGVTVAEGGLIPVLIRLSKLSPVATTVPLTFNGTASNNGADYKVFASNHPLAEQFATPYSSPISVVIPANTGSATVFIKIEDDTEAEGAEQVNIGIGSVVNATVRDGFTARTITIPVNDQRVVSFVATSVSVNESEAFVDVEVAISDTPTAPITVNFAAVRPTKPNEAGSSDVTVTGSSLTFNTGHNPSVKKTIRLTINPDSLDEGDELFNLKLTSISGPGILGESAYQLKILDNDTSKLYFKPADNPVSASTPLKASMWEYGSHDITVKLTGPSINPTPFRVNVPIGSSPKLTLGTDYEIEGLTLHSSKKYFTGTIPAGQTEKTFTVKVFSDAINEPYEVADFTVTNSIGLPFNVLSQFSTYSLTVGDNDPKVSLVSVSAMSYLEQYGVGFGYKAVLDKPTNVNITVDFTRSGSAGMFTSPGRPIADLAYNPIDQLIIYAGQSESAPNFVYVQGDPYLENDETYKVSISGLRLTNADAIGGPSIDSSASSLTYTIVDDDSQVIYVSMSGNARLGTAVGEGETQQFTAYLSRAFSKDVYVNVNFNSSKSINYAAIAGFSTTGLDSLNRVKIPAGQTSASFTVRAKDDKVRDTGTRQLYVELTGIKDSSGSTNFLRVSSDYYLQMTVWDNDTPPAPPPPPPKKAVQVTVTSGTLAVDLQQALDAAGIAATGDEINSLLGNPALANAVLASPTFKPGDIALVFGSGGPLQGTDVFFDANFNGTRDFLDLNGDGIQTEDEPDEPSAVTRLDGSVALSVGLAFDRPAPGDTEGNGVIDPSEGRWVLSGGTDTSTGLPLPYSYTAPVGYFIQSPLTTLAENLVRLHGYEVADVGRRVLDAFGVGELPLHQLPLLQAIARGDVGAGSAYAALVKLSDTVSSISSLFAATPEAAPFSYFADLVYQVLAGRIAEPDTSLELASVPFIAGLIQTISNDAGIALNLDPDVHQAIVDGAATIIATSNEAVDAVPNTANAVYSQKLTEVKKVAQVEAVPALAAVITDADPAAAMALAVTAFTDAGLAAKIAAANVPESVLPPGVTIGNATVIEGESGQVYLDFPVVLVGEHAGDVVVSFTTQDGTATAGLDYVAQSGDLTWHPGDAGEKHILVAVNGDTAFEQDELVQVALTGSAQAVIRSSLASGYILNDDTYSYSTSTSGANVVQLVLDDQTFTSVVNDTVVQGGYQTEALDASITGADNVDDELRLDLTSGTYRDGDSITFHGGGGSGIDTATIVGGSFATIVHTFLNATDGVTSLTSDDGAATVTLRWFGLEPFVLSPSRLDNAVIELPAGVTSAIFDEDPLSDFLRIRSPLGEFERTFFSNPDLSFTLRGGTGVDTISLDAMAAAFNSAFTADIAIDSELGDDAVFVKGTGHFDESKLTLATGVTLEPNLAEGSLTVQSLEFLAGSTYLVHLDAGLAPDAVFAHALEDAILGGATLSVTMGAQAAYGRQFTLLAIDGAETADAFAGLAEGSVFDIGNQTYQITYVGGDGNDVVLTVRTRLDFTVSAAGFLTLQLEGADLVLTDGSDLFRQPLLAVKSFTVNASAATFLQVNYVDDSVSDGYFTLPGGIAFNGSAAADSLFLLGSSFTTVNVSAAGSMDLTPATPGLDPASITFAGVESVSDTTTSANRRFTGSAGSDTINFLSGGSPSQVTIGGFTVLSNDPTTGVQIDAGAGDDQISVIAFTQLPFAMTIVGGADEDSLTVSSQLNLTGALDLDFLGDPADEITLLQSVQLTGGATARIRSTGTATLAGLTTAGGGIELVAGMLELNGALQSSGGTVSIQADSIAAAGSASIDAGAGAITVTSVSTGREIHLGPNTSANALVLTGAFVDGMTASSLSIGNSAAGTVSVLGPITRTTALNISITTGGDFVGGPIDTAGGSLTLAALGSVKPDAAGVDFAAAPLSFAADTDIALAIGGTTPDVDSTVLTLLGSIDLTGTRLLLSGGYTMALFDEILLVDNRGSAQIEGAFAGLADGARIPNFLGSIFTAEIDYQGGDGNDVTLTLVDTFAPAITVSGPSISVTNGVGVVTYTVDYVDASPLTITLAETDIALVGSPTATVAVSGTGNSRTITLSNFTGDGPLGLTIAAGTAADSAGNVAAGASAALTVLVDTTPPTVGSSFSGTAGASGWFTSDGDFTITSSDSGSLVASVFYTLDGGASTPYTTPFAISGDAIHTVIATVTDVAGNQTQQTFTVKIDAAAPTAGSSFDGTAGSGGWFKTGGNVTITSGDTTSLVASVFYTLDGGPSTPYTTPFAITADGTHTVVATVTDVAGNQTQQTLTVMIDATAPTAGSSFNGTAGSNGWFKSGGNFTLTPSDATSLVASVFYTLDGGPSTPYSTPFAINGDGTHSVVATVTDVAGNQAQQTFTVKIDAAAPTSSVSALAAYRTGTSIPVTWTGTDLGTSGIGMYDILVSIDGGAFTLWQSATTATSATYTGVLGHLYSFMSIATDQAGNRQATPASGQPTTRLAAVIPSGSLLVDSAADLDDGDYSAGHLSLREAVGLANFSAGEDTITFAVGPINLTQGSLRLSGTSLTRIVGAVGSGQIVRRSSSAASFGVFVVEANALAEFRNLIITGGQTTEGADLTVGGPDAGLSPNSPGSAGGLTNFGTATVLNTAIQGNSARFGGGVRNAGSLTIRNSTISNNQAIDQGDGGAIWNQAALTLVNVTLSGNSAAGRGGALRDTATTAGAVTITNATIVNNRSDSDGAGAEQGGGISTSGALSGSLVLTNSIVAGNIAGASASPSDIVAINPLGVTSHHNLVGNAASAGGLSNGASANIVGNNGTGTLSLVSILGALADNGGLSQTHALVQNSRAIGAGSTAAPNYIPFDQRGAARDSLAPDLGAYEVQHPLAPVGTPTTYAATFVPKPSADANTAFVKGLYVSTLNREADPAGLAGWVNALAHGGTQEQVAYGFVNSVENRTNQVTFFYKYFLGRTPDPVGLAGWVITLQSGVDEGQVMSGFLLSPEFTGQNDNASFVNLMYYAVLGRQAEPAGFNDWVTQLDTGTSTRDQVGQGFLRSIESITRVVNSYFTSYLKRSIDSAAATPYVALSQAGVSFGKLAASILGSSEFFVAAGQNL